MLKFELCTKDFPQNAGNSNVMGIWGFFILKNFLVQMFGLKLSFQIIYTLTKFFFKVSQICENFTTVCSLPIKSQKYFSYKGFQS